MVNKQKILIVDDDEAIAELVSLYLAKECFDTMMVHDGEKALVAFDTYHPNLVLLDLMLPGIKGEDLIDEIRKSSIIPIIVISAKSAQEDKINVLKIGADDFISKPFDINEVIARVEAQLRRYKKFSNLTGENNKIEHKNLIIDTESRQVYVDKQEVILTAREFSILELLMKNPHKVFTRANLFESVWQDEFMGDDNTVNVHISNLRSKLNKADKENEYIQTVWGIGFKLKE